MDFRLVSPHNCVSEFLKKILLSLYVYIQLVLFWRTLTDTLTEESFNDKVEQQLPDDNSK